MKLGKLFFCRQKMLHVYMEIFKEMLEFLLFHTKRSENNFVKAKNINCLEMFEMKQSNNGELLLEETVENLKELDYFSEKTILCISRNKKVMK